MKNKTKYTILKPGIYKTITVVFLFKLCVCSQEID